jgi:amino acid adenylation domain-containing protein
MLFERLTYQLNQQSTQVAFVIDEQEFTYYQFANQVISVQQLLLQNNFIKDDKVIVFTYDNIETYASIIAVWLLGGVFIPINPKHPKERNALILNQVTTKFKLSSKKNDLELYTSDLKAPVKNLIVHQREKDSLMYILFTSGSTGTPKGVPISYKNINAFITDFAKEYNLSSKDRFLQIYDLTFDASIHCYLLPLYLGASIYTVSPNKIKYLEAYKLMDKQGLTFAKFPPSVLSYLKPYFKKIKLPKLKYSLLGGESLDLELVKLWQNCVPNAQIYNVYGPTEATINTHIFSIPKNIDLHKTYNGTLTIGKPFGSNKAIVIDKENTVITNNSKGEMCLYGDQIANQYFNNLEKTKQAFTKINNEFVYKTGDLVYQDVDGDFIFCGRIDNQVQIQGYRVELSEVENAARQFKKALNFAVISTKNQLEVLEIILFTEQLATEIPELQKFLKTQLPFYMVPSKIINLEKFPQTAGGKIDKQALLKSVN